MPKTVIVIPCFNEERRLDRAEFVRLAGAASELTLLFVDDGSRDRTADVIRDWSRATPTIELHQLRSNAGKAEAVRAGLRRALAGDAEVVGYLDADLATPVDEVLRVLRVAGEERWQVVLASRVKLLGTAIERKATRHYLGRVFATIASMALRIPVYDTQCGAKFFRRSPALGAALEAPFQSRWAFDVELLGRLVRGSAGAPPIPVSAFVEVPLLAWRDVGGSKMRPGTMLRAGLDVLKILLQSRLPRRAKE